MFKKLSAQYSYYIHKKHADKQRALKQTGLFLYKPVEKPDIFIGGVKIKAVGTADKIDLRCQDAVAALRENAVLAVAHISGSVDAGRRIKGKVKIPSAAKSGSQYAKLMLLRTQP